jgi:hypothetical protein
MPSTKDQKGQAVCPACGRGAGEAVNAPSACRFCTATIRTALASIQPEVDSNGRS